MSQQVPKNLGRYRVVRRLGAGGMAEVFLAKSMGAEGIEKVLVVKRILPSFARSTRFITMFVDEAKVAMRLNHPNIVQVYAFEQVKEDYLLAMEFVDGLDLGRLISGSRRSGRRIPYGLAAFILMEVARGLDYAHKRRDEHGEPMEIVHRDVSPQNVLLTYDGVVKVADFGIAKARLVSEETGVIKGKFSYMSPEQAHGTQIDHRSDVYALGVLLAELLMNRAMYPGAQGLDLLEVVRTGGITYPGDVDSQVPQELDAIVRRATARDPEERYQTARSFAGALNQYLRFEDELWDGEALEEFVQEIAPRSSTQDGALVSTMAGATQADFHGIKEHRERRRVIVVSGRICAESTQTGDVAPQLEIDSETRQVLSDLAYKNDAVLSWPHPEKDATQFRFIIGLGKVTVHDSLKGLRLAIDTLEALDGLSADLLRPISAAIGTSRGIVATVRDSTGRLVRYTPSGSVLDVSETLANAAKPSQVLVAGEVYRLVRKEFSFDEKVQEVDVKTEHGSIPHGVRARLLRGLRSREERAADVRDRAELGEGTIGRQSQLDSLIGLFNESVTTGKTVFAGVRGELGIGKSALVAAALRGLSPSPKILRVDSTFGSGDQPYSATAELVRDACSIPDDASDEDARVQLTTFLNDLIPNESVRQRCMKGLLPLISKRQEGEEHSTRVIVRSTELLLMSLSKRSPLVVWMDSLQWADTPSLDLLKTMQQRNYDVPCLVVLCARPDESLNTLFSGVPTMDLSELKEPECRRLLSQRFSGARVSADIEDAIIERAGGNPFFIIELVEALLERGAVSVEGDEVVRQSGAAFQLPTTLEGVIAERFDELPESHRHAIRWLAVAGRGLSVDELSSLARQDMAAQLSELERRGLVVRRGSGFAFPSAVMRHIAYDATDAPDRVRMHRAVAELLSASRKAVPARIARHLEQAGESEAAASAYLQAAEAARSVYSNREAFRFFGRALLLLPPNSTERFRAHAGREQILRFLGRSHERLRELEAMRSLSERGNSTQKAIAANRLARFELDSDRLEGVDELITRSLSLASVAGDIALQVDALRLQAELGRELGNSKKALAACDDALSRVGLNPDLLSARGSVLVQRGILLRRLGRIDEAFSAYAEATVIFRRLKIKRSEAYALNSLGVALASTGAYEDAIIVFQASVLLDRETGDRLRLGRKLSNIAQLYDMLGDLPRAISFVERALDVFEVVDDRAGRCDALTALAEMLLHAGKGVSASAVPLDQARRIATQLPTKYETARERIVRAKLNRESGDLDSSEASAREALQLSIDDEVLSFRVQASTNLAHTLLLKGDRDEAYTQALAALRSVSEGGVERAERELFALSDVLSELGHHEDAKQALRSAQDEVERRLDAIRDEDLRATYLGSRSVRAILQRTL